MTEDFIVSSSWTDLRQLEVYYHNCFLKECFILLSRVITLEHLFTELFLPILTEGDKVMSIDLDMIWKFLTFLLDLLLPLGMCQKHEVNESQVVSVIPNLKNMNKNNARQNWCFIIRFNFQRRIAWASYEL